MGWWIAFFLCCAATFALTFVCWRDPAEVDMERQWDRFWTDPDE